MFNTPVDILNWPVHLQGNLNSMIEYTKFKMLSIYVLPQIIAKIIRIS